MIEITWFCSYCEYLFDDPSKPAGQVRVTTLHWQCRGYDTDTTNFGQSIGTEDVSDQSRQYTLAALQSVPSSVMVNWVHQAMGQEQVDEIEVNVKAQVEAMNLPPGGGLTPEEG